MQPQLERTCGCRPRTRPPPHLDCKIAHVYVLVKFMDTRVQSRRSTDCDAMSAGDRTLPARGHLRLWMMRATGPFTAGCSHTAVAVRSATAMCWESSPSRCPRSPSICIWGPAGRASLPRRRSSAWSSAAPSSVTSRTASAGSSCTRSTWWRWSWPRPLSSGFGHRGSCSLCDSCLGSQSGRTTQSRAPCWPNSRRAAAAACCCLP